MCLSASVYKCECFFAIVAIVAMVTVIAMVTQPPESTLHQSIKLLIPKRNDFFFNASAPKPVL